MPLQLRNSSQGVSNVYGNYVYGAKPNQININHGWKLHAGFVRDSTMQKVLDDVGIEAYSELTKSGHSKPSMRIANQDKFDVFAKRVNDALGVDITKFDNAELKSFMGKFTDLREMMDGSAGATDIFRQLDFYEQANAQGLLFKGDVTQYGSGRELTFYAGELERRDKTIRILESQFGDILQDADDIIPGMPSDKAAKNSKISQKTVGRFTTDYLPVDYKDLTEIAEGMAGREAMVDARGKGTHLPWDEGGALGPDKIHMAQGGEIVPETSEELARMAQQHPELGEALHGKAGYVSPYNTIEDIIENSGVKQTVSRAGGPAQEAIIDSTVKTPPASTADEVSQRVIGQTIDEDIPPMPTDEDFERYATGVDDVEEAVPEPTRTRPHPFEGEPLKDVSKPKEPVIKVGETVELSGPERKTKVKSVDNPAARVTQAGQEAVIDATQRAPRPKPTPAAAQAVAKKAAASRATRSGVQDGARMSSAVASGIRGSNNLRVAAAGAAIGVGAYAMNKLRSIGKDDVEYARMLEMQRHYRR